MNWTLELELAGKAQRVWIDRGKKIVKRYRDDRGETREDSAQKKFNILWSNVQTILPSVYARKPQAQVERRYKDADPVGRTASEILERALQYEIDQYSDYDSALKNCVLDRFLPGRGVAWIRYEQSEQAEDGEQGEQVTDDVEGNETHECSPCDYVFWEDFRHSPARTWEEVTWVARRVYMSREEGVERFGDAFADVPLKHEPVGIDDTITQAANYDAMKKGVVWEIWNKPTREVIWWAEGKNEALDTRPDLYELENFFPCPKPLYATLTTDTLIPIPDYVEYQDQAMELDELTTRIGMLTKAVKVVGVYDASQTALQRMLQEGVDNTLIPVDQWAALAEKNGIKGSVDFLPLEMVIKALNELYTARETCKQVIYEITGMSDILRGATKVETATAQQLKSQFASLRLKDSQKDVARFASDLLQMKAQIMCRFYRPETLVEMSGIALTADAQLAQQAIELLKNESLRNYRIEVAADSMVELDEQAEKQARTEFLGAAAGFLKQAVEAAQMAPELGPLMGEMLMFGVRAYKAGRPIEAAFERAMAQLQQPKPPQPNPEAIKAQAAQAQAQAKAEASVQIAQIQAQAKAQVAAAQQAAQQQTDAMRQQMEMQQHAAELDMKARIDAMEQRFKDEQHLRDMAFEKWKVEKQAETQLGVAQITKQTTMSAQQESAADDAARD